MKRLMLLIAMAGMAISTLRGGTLMISNSKGFNSTVIVDATGMPLTGFDPVIVAVGTFASEPANAIAPPGLTLNGSQYAALLAEFTAYGLPRTLVQPVPPLNLLGVFDFQEHAPVTGTPLAGKTVYVIVAKGASLATATGVCILKTNATFNPAEDENAMPKRVSVGIAHGTTLIAGSSATHMAAASNLDPSLEAAYSLANIVTAPEIAIEQPEGTSLTDGLAQVDFGAVAVGSFAEVICVIRNSGGGTLHLTGSPLVAIGGSEATEFTITSPPAATILPGDHTTFAIRYTPAGGSAQATLSLANDDPDEGSFEIQLSGIGLRPRIVVESLPSGAMENGEGILAFGGTTLGHAIPPVTVTVTNAGDAPLTITAVSVGGPDAADFPITTAELPVSIPAGASNQFAVGFTPTTGASGSRMASLQITSTDVDESPFDIGLTGLTFSTLADMDGDGLNDWAEYQYTPLGFDWQLAQPALVATLNSGANAAGLYTASQVQALHAGIPLILRNPETGKFKVTLDWKKATDLTNFVDFPVSPAEVSVNGSGDIEFEFSIPDPTAFFRLGVE